MLPLYTGEVKADGIDLNFIAIDQPRTIFDRMAGGEEFDVAEFSSSEFVQRFASKQCPFVAIPVFPSRAFRHGFIAVHRKSGIETPKDLEGKRVGVPLLTMTAAIYINGLLQHEYGVDLRKVHWVQGAMNTGGAHGSPTVLPLLNPIPIEQNSSAKSMSDLIEERAVDGANARGGSAIQHRSILCIVGEVAREQIGDPEPDRRMQYTKHRDRDGVTQHAVHQRATPVLLGEAVAMGNEGPAPSQIELGVPAEELDAQVLREKRSAPAVVVAAHERDRDAAGADLLQLGDGGKMFAGDDARILEPEIEQIAHQDEVISGPGDLLEECVKRLADGGRHLTQVRVRHDDDARGFTLERHGPSLGTWNGARKHITVLP